MGVDAEAGLENLRSLRAEVEAKQERNEATTRFQIIDRLLKDVLGWEIADCECEVYRDGDRADYILGNPRRFAVWEAKKESIEFSLPVGLDKRIVGLQTLRRSSDQLREAIDQVQQYAQLHGLAISVVCNGHQIIAFLGSRQDGIAPLRETRFVLCPGNKWWTNFRAYGITSQKLALNHLSSNAPFELMAFPSLRRNCQEAFTRIRD